MSIPKKRDSNLDLLRIVSMFLIIFLHSIDHSGVLEQANVHGGGHMSMCILHMHYVRYVSTAMLCLVATI